MLLAFRRLLRVVGSPAAGAHHSPHSHSHAHGDCDGHHDHIDLSARHSRQHPPHHHGDTPPDIADSPANERSLLRHLIPLRVQGSGPMSALLRHAFLQQDQLIPLFLGTLEQVQLPALPRMLLAEGFQQMLDGRAPQRELRELFEEADVECRKVLLDLDFDAKGNRGLHATPRGSVHDAEQEAFRAVQTDPLRRLLMYELRGAAGYYARMMAVSSEPEVSAAVLLRTLIASDVRLDALIGKVILAFESQARNVTTGVPTDEIGVPAFVRDLVKELLLMERDAFGVYRFDARGDNRMLFHCVKLANIGKTPETYSLLLDETMQRYGNFVVETEEVYGGRWRRYKLRCGEDDLRVLPSLPDLETVLAPDELDGERKMRVVVRYSNPICERHQLSTREGKGGLHHVEAFELAVENKNRTFWEKYFLDR